MAQFILFPCINKANGCSENLTPLAMETHEPICKYGRIACFIDNKKCLWWGARSELHKHLAEKHTDSLLKEPKFQLRLLKSSEYKMFLQYDSEHFLIYPEFDIRQGFKCSIEHFKTDESSDCYSYNLEFIAGKLCHKSHEKSTESEENWVKVNTSFFKNHFKDPASIWNHINFKRHYKEELGIQVEDLLNNPSINWNILASLQCPVCFDYITPPIYQCIQGHPICFTCCRRVDNCPICPEPIVGQNNALEKVTITLNYPCKYHINGCTKNK